MREPQVAVFVTAQDIQAIEDAGYSLYRAGEDTQALTLHALALRLRSLGGIWPKQEFHCEVDASAGMADVVDLHDFSKRVGA